MAQRSDPETMRDLRTACRLSRLAASALRHAASATDTRRHMCCVEGPVCAVGEGRGGEPFAVLLLKAVTMRKNNNENTAGKDTMCSQCAHTQSVPSQTLLISTGTPAVSRGVPGNQ